MKFILAFINLVLINWSQQKASHRLRKGDKDEDNEPLKKTGPLSISKDYIGGYDDSGITFYAFIDMYKNHHMTLGEIKHVYTTADMNKDNEIDRNEWRFFYKLFIKPFERCDEDLDYLLNEKELTKCFESKYLNNTLIKKDKVKQVLVALDKTMNITFIDYMFLRRVNLAWKECTSDFQLAVAKIDCALQIAVPARRVDLPEANQVYRTQGFLKYAQYKDTSTNIALFDFIYISHMYFYFSAFELPFLDGYLNRKDVLRAIENQQLASSLTPNVVNSIFDNDDKMNIDFMHFSSIMYIYQIFIRFSGNGLFIKPDEYQKMIKEKVIPKGIQRLMESTYQPDEKLFNISESVVKGQKQEITEKDFLISFLESDAKYVQSRKFNRKDRQLIKNFYSKMRFKDDEDKVKKSEGVDPEKNLVIFYKLMDVKRLNKTSFPDFSQCIKFMWAFYNFDTDQNGYLVDRELREGLMNANLPIPFNKREQKILNEVLQFLSMGGSYRVNLKEFIAFSNYNQIFESLKAPGSQFDCLDKDLQSGFDQMSIQLSNKTVKYCRDGEDSTLGLPLYNYQCAFKTGLEKEIVASRLFNIGVKDKEGLEQVKKGRKL